MENLSNTATNKQAVLDQPVANNLNLVATNSHLFATNDRFIADNTNLQLAASNTYRRRDTSLRHNTATHTYAIPKGWTIGGY